MKKTRSILTMLAVLVMLTCALSTTAFAAEYADWAAAATAATNVETDGDYYVDGSGDVTIYTAKGLAWVADQVNTGADTFDGKTVTLANSIDLEDAGVTGYASNMAANVASWTPIGDSTNKFKGIFDGGDYEVSNLYINVSESSDYYAGLFGYVDGGTVKNVSVSGSIDVTTSGNGAIIGAGGVVGQNMGSVTNCSADVAISTSGGASNYAGGVVGDNTGTGSVTNCYATGAISASNGDDNGAGGVAGRNNIMGSVTNCYATGTVSASGTSNNYAGGVVGYIEAGSVKNCYATGAVTASGGSDNYAGGVVGYNSDTVTDCYWLSTATHTVGGSELDVAYKKGIGNAADAGNDTINNVVSFTDTGALTITTNYDTLLAALNTWVYNEENTAYRTWVAGTGEYTYPVFGAYWVPLTFTIDRVDEALDPSNYTLTSGSLMINTAGTYEIGATKDGTITQGIFIISSAGDVTLIFDNVTMGIGGNAIKSESSGTLTIQGTLTVTCTSGNGICVVDGDLTITGENTVVVASSTNSSAISADSAPTLNDNLVARASNDTGSTYTQAVTWASNTYQVSGEDAKYIKIAYEEPVVSSGGGISYFTSTLASADNGEVSLSGTRNQLNSVVTITATPDDGYEVQSVTVTYGTSRVVSVTDNGDGTYSYKQPGATATVTVTFAADEDYDGSDDGLFADVDGDDWFYDAVKWAVDAGVTTGKSETLFAPDDINTRAEAVTFLWRAMSEPEWEICYPFADVDADIWYTDAVYWARVNGITQGTTEDDFSPDESCTRGQIVTFLYRLAGEPEVAGTCDFTDVDADEYYADAVLWAVQNGITDGMGDGTFEPDADCTRAQIVTFLYRYLGE